MFLLYSLLLLMLISTVSLLAVPFARRQKNRIKSGLAFTFIIVMAALGLYRATSDQTALAEWLSHGKRHYQLLEEVDRLGGIDGIIVRVKLKLQNNPNDAEGWKILGKLYLQQQNNAAAEAAFRKAEALQQKN